MTHFDQVNINMRPNFLVPFYVLTILCAIHQKSLQEITYRLVFAYLSSILEIILIVNLVLFNKL